jgi:hypothetical protein
MARGIQRARKDANQAGIEQALKHLGISYADTSALGKGYPDLAIGHNGVTYLFEIKQPCKNPLAELTPQEETFMANWSGHYAIVTTLEEVLKEIGF